MARPYPKADKAVQQQLAKAREVIERVRQLQQKLQ